MGTRVITGSGVSAGNVYIVDSGGNGDFTTIQAAINAANGQGPALPNQWLVLVAPGQYQESLTLFDHVNVSAFSPDKGAFLNGTGDAAIVAAATCTVSHLRIKSQNTPMIKTGSYAAGKVLRLSHIIVDEDTPDIAGVQAYTGTVILESCSIQCGGVVAIVGSSGELRVYDSRLIRYYTGEGTSNPALLNQGGGLEVLRSSVENLTPTGEAISYTGSPASMNRLLHSIIKKSSSASYAIGGTVAAYCLLSECILNGEPQSGVLSDVVDYMLADDL